MVEKVDPASILLVDDATENLSLLEALLQPLGHRIFTANTGQQALALANQETFSLIILDVRMPGLNGFETAIQIQQQFQQKNSSEAFIPIIFLTATADAEEEICQGYQLGAMDYVIKPFNSKLLLNKVKNFIQFFQQQQTLLSQNLTLQTINEQLHNQYLECQRIEQELQQVTVNLEELVVERTQSLQESEMLYRTVLSHISDAVFITDTQGNFTFVCPNIDYIWGYTQAEILTMKNIRELLGVGLANAESLSLHDQVVNIEQQILDRHGHAHDLLINVKRVEIQGGALLYSCRDVTDYKRAERAIQKSEENLQNIIGHINDAILILDSQGKIIFINPQVEELLGRSPQELLNHHFGYPVVQNITEITILNPQRGLLTVEMSVTEIWWQDSLKMLVTLHDVSERQQMQETLSRSEAHYRHLLANIQCGVVVHAPDTSITYVNPTATEFLGVIDAELQGKGAEDPQWRFYHGDGSQMTLADFPVTWVMREKKILNNYEMGVYRHDLQTVLWAWVTAYPEFDDAGNIIQIIVTFLDITERKTAEFALHNLNEELGRMVEDRTQELEASNQQLLREILEREQIDMALQEEEAKYRALMKDASDAIFVMDTDRHVLEVNQAAEILTGYRRQELRHLPQGYFIPMEHQDRMESLWQQILQTRRGSWSDAALIKKGGQSVPVDMTGSLIQYDDKTIVQLILRDITERKRSEAQIQKSEAQFRAIFESAAIGIVLVNPLGYFYRVNPAFVQLLGYSETELSHLTFLDINHPEERDQNWKVFQELITGQRDFYQTEKRYLRQDKTILWGFLTVSLVRNLQRHPQFLVGMVEDITERKQAQESLQQNQLFLRNLIDVNPSCIFVKDAQGYYTLANQALAQLYQCPIEDIIGKNDYQLSSNREESEIYYQMDQQVIQSQTAVFLPEETFTLPNGEKRIFQTHKVPVYSPDGTVNQVLGVATDITERKQAEEEIKKSLAKEKELNEMKSQFVDIVSHEFRTPLTSILGFTALLERYHERITPEKQLHYIKNIQLAGGRLKDLIDDVLCISRAESGRLQVAVAPIALGEFCQGLAEEFTLGIGEHHSLNIQVADNVPDPIYGDERLLQHILGNLLSNAAKYSSPGSAVQLSMSADATHLTIQISDQGIGIPPEDQHHLFESFHRASNVGDIPGTGLGLNIVKRYVELQGGTIHFISEVDQGTTFFLCFPLVSTHLIAE